MEHTAPPKTDNVILAALPPEERQRLTPKLQLVDIVGRQAIHDRGEPVAHVYFPAGALFSVLSRNSEGRVVEVGAIGTEGFVGIPLVLEDERPAFDTIGQVPGRAWRMRADDLRAELARGGDLRRRLLRFAQALTVQTGQNAACHRLHGIDQRTARWLLHSVDWIGRERFELTQEFLAYMLGVRRPSVTTAAAMLQRAGFITYHRGVITVLDRPGLEAAACDCYGIIRNEYRRLVTR